MSSDRVLAELSLDSEIAALCLEERPQLFALAGVDHETENGGLIGRVLAWPNRVVVYWDGQRDVSSYRSFADFWRSASRHERSGDVRIIPMDGQPVPDLD
ncbi:hypothetical protein [Allosalinactinospora lopnorensis]|uniref:hypothetical protein n=1 Tax=Allosalinactinospora lopnorensis TaxID=1352348 RepID=UPI000623D5DE|nr:hypothetical protein [Allosalinactinospora lopnorensis]